jgi:hypothetical protein
MQMESNIIHSRMPSDRSLNVGFLTSLERFGLFINPPASSGNEAGVSLKPKDLGVTSDSFIPTTELPPMLLHNLNKITNDDVRYYCSLLVKYYSKRGRR